MTAADLARPEPATAMWKATIVYRSAAGQLVEVEHAIGQLEDVALIAHNFDLATLAGICIQPIEKAARQ